MAAGCELDSLDCSTLSPGAFKKCIPILLKWLPRIEDVGVKEYIVRSLSVPSAKAIAAQPLIVEFRNTPNTANSGLKWVIGNALSIVATDAVFKQLLDLIGDKANGKSREMLVLALGNMENAAAVDKLIEMLNDEEIAGHALKALGKLRAPKALAWVRPFVNHPKAWIRNEAKRALIKIDKGN
jgi:HEAT repeat protein